MESYVVLGKFSSLMRDPTGPRVGSVSCGCIVVEVWVLSYVGLWKNHSSLVLSSSSSLRLVTLLIQHFKQTTFC